MSYKIFYLDDENDELIDSYIKQLQSTGDIAITREQPESFEEEISNLEDILSDYDAVLLDLQLDGPSNIENKPEKETGKNNKVVKYQAPSLAQSIRTMATKGTIQDLPIILCSTEDRIKETFKSDYTSHNLFDWTFLKKDINFETIQKIIDLIKGYKFIWEAKTDIDEILGRIYNEIDPRILSRFINEKSFPIHELARTIFKGVIQSKGVLIDENTIAARLGIDIERSEDWDKLLDIFEPTRYKGVFGNAWKRWWEDQIIDKFEDLTSQNLASLNAPQRVSALIQFTDLKNLSHAEPIKFCESLEFWNICEVTKKPIDPFEAFKINDKQEPMPWQDYSYVSLYAFMEKIEEINKLGIKVHPTDQEKLRIARKSLD